MLLFLSKVLFSSIQTILHAEKKSSIYIHNDQKKPNFIFLYIAYSVFDYLFLII